MRKNRPNILFLMTDQTHEMALRPDSPCKTPNLDKLSQEGCHFQRCTTPNAICSPARASLMTGLYPSTHGIWDVTHGQRRDWLDMPAGKVSTFSQVLADHGYRNGYFGKWHVEQSSRLEDFGWHTYNMDVQGVNLPAGEDNRVEVSSPGYPDYLLAAAGNSEAHARHPAFEMGIDFLREQADSDQPFCCFVSTIEPHDPYIPPREYLDQYDPDTLPLSPSLRDPCEDKPEVVRRMASVWKDLSDADWQKVSAAYWATISFLDAEVGRILEVLRETGQEENTIVVFTSDHGDMLGAHGLIAKGVGTSYEEVYNIPLIVRSPEGKKALVSSSRVSLVDLGPTLLDLCGLPAIPGAQGRSFRGVLDGSEDDTHWKNAYAEFYSQRFFFTQRVVWHDDWKYVFTPGGKDELYNLTSDPYERCNRIDDETCKPKLHMLCKQMWETMSRIGDDSLLNTQYATLRTAPVGPLGL